MERRRVGPIIGEDALALLLIAVVGESTFECLSLMPFASSSKVIVVGLGLTAAAAVAGGITDVVGVVIGAPPLPIRMLIAALA